MMLLPVLRLSR